MPEYLTQQESFLKCKKDGKFIIVEDIDFDAIKSTAIIANADIASANLVIKSISKESLQWSSVYKLYYDALHELVEAFLRFERVKIDNHQCLFAYICEKHPELELHWDFFEKVRTKRNGIHYYGVPVKYEDWKDVALPFALFIKKLSQEINKRLK